MRYRAAALALQAFSANNVTRWCYRRLGDLRNRMERPGQPILQKYYFRTENFLRMLRRHGALRPGMRFLEMGTGWVHWEATMVRNEVAAHGVLYDVWDNRSLPRFRNYVRQLADPAVRARLGLTAPAGAALMAQVAQVQDFTEAYRLCDFEYVVDPEGLMRSLPEESFDLIVSSDVGEHLPRAAVADILRRSFALLKPGGIAYHQIVLTDHLGIYARNIHPKEYLRFDRETYDRRYGNAIQYINLIQIPEWRALFTESGFEIVEMERIGMSDLSNLPVHPAWRDVSAEDLSCTVVQFLLRRPAES
jgi:predicted SAM-dependent methyltransferase